MGKRASKDRHGRSPAAAAEHKKLAEQLIDMILNPHNHWLLHYFLAGGFNYPGNISKEFAVDTLQPAKFDFPLPKEVFDAAMERNRDRLIALVTHNLLQRKLDPDNLQAMLRVNPAVLRRATREVENIFDLRRGTKRKIWLEQYPELAAWAERLEPVIHDLLDHPLLGTRQISDLLAEWQVDHPEACSFLLRHLIRLRQAMEDTGLTKTGMEIKSRAEVLADALAGSDYNFTFRTSIERVREARNRLRETL